MPRAKQRCSPTCPNIKGECPKHKPVRVPWENKREREFLKSAEWQRQRRRVLHRDNEENGGCQLRFDGCTLTATQVDHKMPTWYTGQEQVGDDDLQGVCAFCHGIKTSYEGVQAKRIKKARGY